MDSCGNTNLLNGYSRFTNTSQAQFDTHSVMPTRSPRHNFLRGDGSKTFGHKSNALRSRRNYGVSTDCYSRKNHDLLVVLPQPRHKLKNVRMGNGGFMRVSADCIFVAKIEKIGGFFTEYSAKSLILNGRNERIRTSDPLHPINKNAL